MKLSEMTLSCCVLALKFLCFPFLSLSLKSVSVCISVWKIKSVEGVPQNMPPMTTHLDHLSRVLLVPVPVCP